MNKPVPSFAHALKMACESVKGQMPENKNTLAFHHENSIRLTPFHAYILMEAAERPPVLIDECACRGCDKTIAPSEVKAWKDAADTLAAEQKIKIIRLTNLLGEIVQQATENPAKLTAFNSPLLSKACIELWNHNNPDNPVDERTAQIYDQMALVGYNG